MPDPAQVRSAHAKLNLALRILAREDSGFHQIETIFCALELADEVAIEFGGHGISLAVVPPSDEVAAPPDPGPAAQNLAYRAAALFVEETGLDRGIRVRLTKRIPVGAGLGGGSSDAAAVLAGLNRMSGGALSPDRLLELGARLGSDVPFFLAGAPLALAWGRGGRLAPLAPLPSAPVLLIVPPERVSTADAYAALAAAGPRAPAPAVLDVRPAAWRDLASRAHNDFEDVVFARHPRLRGVRDLLEGCGAVFARMTGTGSVVFGLFDDVAAAEKAMHRVQAAHPDADTLITRTLAGA